jgi:hypothetical protein
VRKRQFEEGEMPRRYSADISRRSALGLLGLGAVLLAAPGRSALAQVTPSEDPNYANLQPGQFLWHPERAPQGPVAILVSIPRQLVFVYRNGILIGVSTCSTGKPGHSTPAGVFTILAKAKVHTSATYGEPMPDMEKLTWKGIALHVGDLPGYPDSHGCVHLPQEFADDLYAITQVGTPVILAGGHTDPASVADPGAILGTTAREEIAAKLGGKPIPSLSPDAVMSILVSRGDMKIYVLENANIVAEGAAIIKDPEKPIGSNVFVWKGGDAHSSTWEGMGFHADPGVPTAPDSDVLQRIDGAPQVMDVIRDRIKPGTVLVTTDLPATPETRSGEGFTVMAAAPS